MSEDEDMAPPAGNRFWQQRSSHGRKPVFDDPEKLWAACVEYFEWVEANALFERKAFGTGLTVDVPKMRAMTVEGLCLFLGITKPTWASYRTRKGFEEVCARVDDVIRVQKFEGAAAGLLQPAIIARDLGLAERQELTGKDGAPLTGGWDSLSPFERVKATGYLFLRAMRGAVEAGDERARDQGLSWVQAVVADVKRLETGKDKTNGTDEKGT